MKKKLQERKLVMEICTGITDRKHEELIFSTGDCPLCTALDKIESLDARIIEKDEQITRLTERLLDEKDVPSTMH